MNWLDTVTAVLAIVVAPLALRNFLRGFMRNANARKADNARNVEDDRACDCTSTEEQFPREEEPPSERQPDSR